MKSIWTPETLKISTWVSQLKYECLTGEIMWSHCQQYSDKRPPLHYLNPFQTALSSPSIWISAHMKGKWKTVCYSCCMAFFWWMNAHIGLFLFLKSEITSDDSASPMRWCGDEGAGWGVPAFSHDAKPIGVLSLLFLLSSVKEFHHGRWKTHDAIVSLSFASEQSSSGGRTKHQSSPRLRADSRSLSKPD